MDGKILENIPLFSPLSADQRQELANLLEERLVPAGGVICWIGETGQEFFLIRGGRVTICYPDADGREVTLAVLGAGDFFGEISLLDGGPRTATARADNDVELLVLGREAFHGFLRQNPQAAVHMMSVLGARQRQTVDKLRGIRNLNDAVEEQLTRWQRISEWITQLSTTQAFVILNIIIVVVWVAWNAILGEEEAFDPEPFELMGFMLGFEAMILSLFVLITQNRENDRDRLRADLDYQVNLKAHLEIMGLHQKMDRTLGRLDELETRLAEAKQAGQGGAGIT